MDVFHPDSHGHKCQFGRERVWLIVYAPLLDSVEIDFVQRGEADTVGAGVSKWKPELQWYWGLE